MSLTSGTRLGAYEILEAIGAGGSARGPASEPRETSRRPGGGAPGHCVKQTNLAHPEERR